MSVLRTIGRRFRNFTDNPVAPGAERDSLLVRFYFCLLLVLLLTRLQDLILLEFDDMTHAAMGVSILSTGDWFTMHEGVLPTWIKPPLYFWVEALLFKLFGISEYWSRFPSALSGFLCIALTYRTAARLWNGKTAFLTLLVLSTSYFFLKYSRRAMLDVPVAFATALGVYALVRAEYENRKGLYLLYGAAAALGYYFKGVQGLYLLGIAPAYFVLSGQARKIFSRHFLGAVFLSFALIACWAAPQALKYGREFIQSQSGAGPLLQMGVPSKHSPFYEPFTVLLGIYWPWIPFSLFGLWLSVKGLRRAEDPRPFAMVLAWFGTILLALSASSAFYLRYLIPLVPPLGIFSAVALGRLIKDADMNYVRHISAAVFSLLVLVAVCFPVKLDRQGTQYISFYRTVNQVVPADARLLLYKDKGYRFIHGLVFYAGRTLEKQVMNADILLREHLREPDRTYTVATASDFKELASSGKIPDAKVEVIASAENWYLFRLR